MPLTTLNVLLSLRSTDPLDVRSGVRPGVRWDAHLDARWAVRLAVP